MTNYNFSGYVYYEKIFTTSFLFANSLGNLGAGFFNLCMESKYFQFQVMALPVAGDTITPFYEFLQNYGTHFVSEVYMGAKAIHESEFTATNYQSLKSKNINIQVKKDSLTKSPMVFLGNF